jgi:DNA-binding Xre family transcriptional regulator
MKNNIKIVRQQKGKSLYWLAKNTGLAYRNLWDVEHGADVKLSTLYRIAEALQCKVTDLI